MARRVFGSGVFVLILAAGMAAFAAPAGKGGKGKGEAEAPPPPPPDPAVVECKVPFKPATRLTFATATQPQPGAAPVAATPVSATSTPSAGLSVPPPAQTLTPVQQVEKLYLAVRHYQEKLAVYRACLEAKLGAAQKSGDSAQAAAWLKAHDQSVDDETLVVSGFNTTLNTFCTTFKEHGSVTCPKK